MNQSCHSRPPIFSDVWQGVESKAVDYYWQSRIQFLCNVRSPFASRYTKLVKSNFINNILKKVDDFGYVSLFRDDKEFSWTKDSPYNQVNTIEQYYKPYDYFHAEDAHIIKSSHSLKSEIYWISHTYTEKDQLKKKYKVFQATIRRLIETTLSISLLFLGSVSGGILWPTTVRRSILSYGFTNGDEEVHFTTDAIVSEQHGINKHDYDLDDRVMEKIDTIYMNYVKVNLDVVKTLDPVHKLTFIEQILSSLQTRDIAASASTEYNGHSLGIRHSFHT